MINDVVKIRRWVPRGKMWVRTSALDGDDPDHPYNQALRQVPDPEAFGLEKPTILARDNR